MSSSNERATIRIPEHLVTSARVVASIEGKSLAALIEEIVAPEILRRERELVAKRAREIQEKPIEPAPPKKRGRPRKDRKE